MALFRKKQVDTAKLPKEIDEYYKAERRERTGMAWLLAIVTVVLTLLLAFVLYFGGRWVYRTVFKKDNSGTTTSQNNTNKDQTSVTTKDESNNSTNTPSPKPTGQGSSGTTPTPSPTPVTNPAPVPTPNPTPTTQPQTTPNTGPGDTIAIFVATTAVATAAHYAYLQKRRRQV